MCVNAVVEDNFGLYYRALKKQNFYSFSSYPFLHLTSVNTLLNYEIGSWQVERVCGIQRVSAVPIDSIGSHVSFFCCFSLVFIPNSNL